MMWSILKWKGKPFKEKSPGKETIQEVKVT